MRFFVVGALLMIGALGAQHVWEPFLETTNSGLQVFIDRSSVGFLTEENVHMTSAWFKALRLKSNKQVWVQLAAFDCSARTMASMSFTEYDSRGKMTKNINTPSGIVHYGLQPVVPDTVGEAMLEHACHSGNPK